MSMSLTDYEQLHPHITYDGITFVTPNTHCAWRVESLETKEPDTMAWIKAMPKDAVLFDIGANMGQYSMVAAKRGITVHAFEPESQNFALMCRNLAMNKFPGVITPWPIALSDCEGFDSFFVTSLMPGGSCNSFGEAVDYHLRPKKFPFRQGCYGTTLNNFCQLFGIPTHIKLDVDGIEHKILIGARDVLPQVQSVLVEINTALPEHMALFELMAECGFEPDMATAEQARRKDGPFKGVGNVIWYRKQS
jgi:FkbM family methyltransferase